MKVILSICAALIVGLLLALWRLDHVSTSLTAAENTITTLESAADSRRNTQRLLADLDTQHTQERERANQTNADLRAAVASGAHRLSVKAACPAVRTATTSARVGDAEARAELDPASAERIVATGADGDDAIRALNTLQDYVATVCIPRK